MVAVTRKRQYQQAHRWFANGDHPADGVLHVLGKPVGQEGRLVRYFRCPKVSGKEYCSLCNYTYHDHGWIDSGGDGQTVCPGNWILEEKPGQYRVLPDDVFRLQYEAWDEDVYATAPWYPQLEDSRLSGVPIRLKLAAMFVQAQIMRGGIECPPHDREEVCQYALGWTESLLASCNAIPTEKKS